MGGGGESARGDVPRRSRPTSSATTRLASRRCASSIANPTASLYNNRTQVLAALEFACLDILGQKWGVPVYDILGGKLQDRVPFASYLFFRYPSARRRRRGAHGRAAGRARARAEAAARLHHAQAQGRRLPAGVRAGVLPRAGRGVARRTASASIRTACGRASRRSASAQAIEDLNNDYFEDPVFRLNGMRRVREMVRIPLATNTVVVELRAARRPTSSTRPSTSILLDTTFWGGIRQCVKAAGVCETFQLGVAVHSSGELGIQLATMLHLGRRHPEPHLRRRRALPPPHRRRHRGREDEVRERRDRGADGARAWA